MCVQDNAVLSCVDLYASALTEIPETMYDCMCAPLKVASNDILYRSNTGF